MHSIKILFNEYVFGIVSNSYIEYNIPVAWA